ncbi:MAG: hypothetical protein JNL43_11500 [Flavobacteriales bacterium]|nr:hypothetical protein [Flavobacteriales bacterium]
MNAIMGGVDRSVRLNRAAIAGGSSLIGTVSGRSGLFPSVFAAVLVRTGITCGDSSVLRQIMPALDARS